MEYQKENLVALIFAPNRSRTNVVSLDNQVTTGIGIMLDLETGTWKYPSGFLTNDDLVRKIGESKLGWARIIGVYDKTNLLHLDRMVRDGQDAVKPVSAQMDRP